ncbi:MAG: hypothetical protein ACRC0G_13380 [Fusobacteriaceae bacterium]
MKEYIFQCFVSGKSYPEKPTEKESKILNIMRDKMIESVTNGKEAFKYSLEQIAKHIKSGKTIAGSITDTTRLLILDVDKGINEADFIKKLDEVDMKPNIYYRTFSWDPTAGKYKMRAIYKLDKDYNREQMREIYKMLDTVFQIDGKSYLDPALKSIKQLVHGTNKDVALIHNKAFSPRELAKRVGYIPPPKVVREFKEVKAITNNQSLNTQIDNITNFYEIYRTSWSYEEGLYIYLALRMHNLDTSISFNSSQETERYYQKMESAFQKGYFPAKGSVGAKMLGALNSMIEKQLRG